MTRKHLNLNRGKNRFSFLFVYRRFGNAYMLNQRRKSTFSFPIELLDHVPLRFSVIEHILVLQHSILFRLSIYRRMQAKSNNNTNNSSNVEKYQLAPAMYSQSTYATFQFHISNKSIDKHLKKRRRANKMGDSLNINASAFVSLFFSSLSSKHLLWQITYLFTFMFLSLSVAIFSGFNGLSIKFCATTVAAATTSATSAGGDAMHCIAAAAVKVLPLVHISFPFSC